MVYECGNIEVVAPTGPDIMDPGAAIRLVSCSAPPQVNPGETFDISFTVKDVGTSYSVWDLRADVGGQTSTSGSVSFAFDDTQNATVTMIAPTSPGTYDIRIYPEQPPGDTGNWLPGSSVVCSTVEVVATTGPKIMDPGTAVRLVSCSAPSQVNVGERFGISFTVEDLGDLSGTWFQADVGGQKGSSDPVSFYLDDTQSGEINIQAPSTPGTYDITIYPEDVSAGRWLTGSSVFCSTVEVVSTFDESAISITDCSTSADIGVATVDEITASASIRNDNLVAAEVTVDFSGGSMENTVRVFIPASSTETISSGFVFSNEGTKTIEVTVASANRTRGSVT